MTEPATPLDPDGLKCGLLMEGAERHQRLAEAQLEMLRIHTEGLDAVVRETIRRTLVEELRGLTLMVDQATRALAAMKRAANARMVGWSGAASLLCTLIPLALMRWGLPSAAEIRALRAERDELAQSVARLEDRGGRVAFSRCGADRRLCVRVDRKSPAYGEGADYFVVRGN